MKPLAIDLFCATYKTHPIEYRAWSGMRTRCRNPNSADWRLYGGRGISVCERWDSFANFFADMGAKPSQRHSLDRKDSDGNYEPTNCRWATAKQQARNWKNRNVLFEHDGESLTLPEWAERLGITRESLRDRIEGGWPISLALTTPPIRSRQRRSDGTFASFGN